MPIGLTGRGLAIAVVLGSLALAPAIAAGDASEKMTSLPLYDGLTFQQAVDAPVCRKKAQINIYNAPQTARLADYLAWYRDHLPRFHHVHKTWSRRAQELFYSADGSKGVSLTGSAVGPGVFSVSYLKLSVSLTTHEMDAFDPSHPSCK